MTVKELILKLQNVPEDAEIGYQVGQHILELLIGDNPNTGEMITIPEPDWN